MPWIARILLLAVACVGVEFCGAQDQMEVGPFAANGIRNGWADQTSIVIWTRTTKNKEMVTDGPNFKKVDPKIASAIRKSGNEKDYLKKQLPEGGRLSQMLGYCPGQPGDVRLKYFEVGSEEDAKATDFVTTRIENDCTAQWKLTGLKPGTQYGVIVETRADADEPPVKVARGRFRTAPTATSGNGFKFCVTTCHDFERRDDGEKGHKIYVPMAKMDPDFVIHAGDIEYYDKPRPFAWTKTLMRFKWQRLFAMPRNRAFYSNHTSYFIKDDHDTLKNDCWSGQRYGTVTFEEGVRLFNEEQFPTHPTRYETIRWGKHVQFWILEGRDFRSSNQSPDGPGKSILGSAQKAWLKKSLNESDAQFKLIFSPTPIVGPDRKNKRDNHANKIFAFEGNELREHFSGIEGLIVFCGDRHWQYASVDSKTGVWEFGCGPGSEVHQLGWKEGDVRPVHRFLRVAGGFLGGELMVVDQKIQLAIRHYDVDGNQKSEFLFPPVAR